MLSYVEHYRPSYFLLENVDGMTDFKFSEDLPGAKGEVIKWGMIKYILRVLIALGYQCQLKKLQAAVYGVPQSRNRVIFWGAKRGITCPKFPVPIFAPPHSYAAAKSSKMPNLINIPPPSRALWPEGPKNRWHQCAPLPHISIFDAIMDLPAFEWGLPKVEDRVYKPSGPDPIENGPARQWLGKSIHLLDAYTDGRRAPAPDDGSVGCWSTRLLAYACPPMTQYQQWLRKGMVSGEDGKPARVTGQYTATFEPLTVERTVRVPLHPGADHTDLHKVLWPDMAKPKGDKKKGSTWRAHYGRSDGNGHFRCALTALAPQTKNTYPLHPYQRRIFTVRELARAQGFPDHYEFCSAEHKRSKIIKDQIKQIGNAVAVPFAMALGKELGRARMADWAVGKGSRDESPEL